MPVNGSAIVAPPQKMNVLAKTACKSACKNKKTADNQRFIVVDRGIGYVAEIQFVIAVIGVIDITLVLL